MSRYGMIIDLQKCVGCGACAIACKTENNTPNRTNGQTFNWADFMFETKGGFPDVEFSTIPVLCNHCTNAPCVEVCPVTPKAMFKTKDNITMHNDKRCIGCRLCQGACPYSNMDVELNGKGFDGYSVISYNTPEKKPHGFYRSREELIKGCTASGAEVAKQAGSIPPHRTRYRHPDYEDVRRVEGLNPEADGIVEKCILCEHRVKKDEAPWCVASCPANARIFGDLDDPNGDSAKLLKRYKATRLKEEEGTSPNVYYIRQFKAPKKA